jgi:hypothetical protein
MRRLTTLALAALLAACGDGDDDGGNGGGGGTAVTLTGPLAASLNQGFYGPVAGACDPLGTGNVGFAGAFVALSTAPALCSEAIAGREVGNATTLFFSIAKVATTAATTTLDAAAYPLFTGSLPAIDAQGNLRFSVIGASRSGTSAGAGLGCTTVGEGAATSGSVTITAVSATSISGSVTATLDDGSSASGTFTASTCGLSLTVDPTSCEPTGLPQPTACTT